MDEEEEQSIDIYHNPRCSKSRATLALLEERGVDVSVIEYLKEPVDDIELRQILDLLAIPARDLLRKSESLYTCLLYTSDAAESYACRSRWSPYH